MKVIGLTGGIASGKSTIARRFAEHGAVVVDADILARQAVEVGSPTLARIVDTFGSQVVASDGSLDRSALARIVFSDSAARNTLNSIVHPEVRRRGAEAIEQAYAKNPNVIVVYDIPLLAEGRTRDEFDLVIVATATHSVRRARLIEMRGLSKTDAEARISAQVTDEQRESIADVLIDTSGTLAATLEQVDALWYRMMQSDVSGLT